jgi:hypothetical protein
MKGEAHEEVEAFSRAGRSGGMHAPTKCHRECLPHMKHGTGFKSTHSAVALCIMSLYTMRMSAQQTTDMRDPKPNPATI